MCSLFEYVPGGGASGMYLWGELVQLISHIPGAVWTVCHSCTQNGAVMDILDGGECMSRLMEYGSAVNSPGDALGQTPAHLAAFGGQAGFLLWQLQTGIDINQQDFFGEALIHKAARSGSLQCLSVLVAHDARLDVCNKDGCTAEDIALSGGFPECAKYLATVKSTQDMFSRAQSSMRDLKEMATSSKRGQCNTISASYGKRSRPDGLRWSP